MNSRVAALTLATATVAYVGYRYFARRSSPVVVERLIVYPIKSCAGEMVTKTVALAQGLRGDRCCVVVDATGAFVNANKCKRLLLLRPTISESLVLRVTAESMAEALTIDLAAAAADASLPTAEVDVYRVPARAVDLGDAAAAWISRAIGVEGHRLMLNKSGRFLANDKNWGTFASPDDQCAFANNTSYMVLSSSAMDTLNAKLKAQGRPLARIEQFRPNVVVSGCAPHAEDDWQTTAFGDDTATAATLRRVKLCTRCPMINLDTLTATVMGEHEPTATLKTYRLKSHVDARYKTPAFGLQMALAREGPIAIGDVVHYT